MNDAIVVELYTEIMEGRYIMRISGLQKLTLLDYPGKMAAIVFLHGCNFLCPFCHNGSLVTENDIQDEIKEEELFAFLNKRRNILDGIVISGGEPLLQHDTPDLIKKIKELGYFVKLDTNGSFPERLEDVIKSGAVDYIAMDIKNSKKKYSETVGRKDFDIKPIEKSVEILKSADIPYEFRTTVVKEFHNENDFYEIGKWLEGADRYFLQVYKDSDGVIMKGLNPPNVDKLQKMREISRNFISEVEIRGI